MLTPVVLLHGFATTARHWDRVIAALPPERYAPLALNLTDADALTPDGVADLVAARTDRPCILVGYSMGGRLAVHTSLQIPDRVARLVLISTTAGIEDRAERAARRAADDLLADEIEHSSISSFVARWRALPLFAQDPAWVHDEVADDERRCTPVQLAGMLRGLGAGAMAPMWDRLGELRMPVAVLAGEHDAAYLALGRRLAAGISDSSFRAAPGAGHRVALQSPAAVVSALAASRA